MSSFFGFFLQAIDGSAKKARDGGSGSNSGVLLDADEMAFLESGAPSPVASEISHGSGKILEVTPADDSSNEALVVDCDSPGGSSAPGMLSCFTLIFADDQKVTMCHSLAENVGGWNVNLKNYKFLRHTLVIAWEIMGERRTNVYLLYRNIEWFLCKSVHCLCAI